MPFDYGFRFAGHGATASNLSLGPVEDLNISVYDRADGAPLRVDFDINPALHTAADLAILSAAISEAVGSNRRCRPSDRQSFHSGCRPSATPSCGVWNDTAQAPSALTFPELFAAQAARTPDAVAVVFEDRTLTYAALDAHANRLAHHLQSLGVGPRDRGGAVRRALARDGDRAARHPQGRRRLSADRCRLSARASGVHAGRRRRGGAGDAVGAGGSDAGFRDRAASFGSMPTHRRSRGSPTTAPPLDLDPRHPAYVIYTSGSTGAPKAVVVEHASLTNKMLALGQDFEVNERFRAALLISSAFDPSIEQALAAFHGWRRDGCCQRRRSGIARSILAAGEARRSDVHQLRAVVF